MADRCYQKFQTKRPSKNSEVKNSKIFVYDDVILYDNLYKFALNNNNNKKEVIIKNKA